MLPGPNLIGMRSWTHKRTSHAFLIYCFSVGRSRDRLLVYEQSFVQCEYIIKQYVEEVRPTGRSTFISGLSVNDEIVGTF